MTDEVYSCQIESMDGWVGQGRNGVDSSNNSIKLTVIVHVISVAGIDKTFRAERPRFHVNLRVM
jgi:hypothetical protein